MSLVELVIALAVLAIALMALMSSVMSASSLQDTTREKTLAYNAARQRIEEVRNASFSQIFSTYKKGAALNTFTVPGLNALPGIPVGQVLFPENAGSLREDYHTIDPDLAQTLGMASPGKDLNRDGTIDSVDHGGDYKILPLVVRVQWQGVGKRPTKIEVSTFITVK